MVTNNKLVFENEVHYMSKSAKMPRTTQLFFFINQTKNFDAIASDRVCLSAAQSLSRRPTPRPR